MNKIIVNADDFGLSRNVNNAIMTAMDTGICMDTTMLMNFEHTEEAAKLAISNKKVENIGIHLNLTQGQPLTKKIRTESLFCDTNGIFNNKKTKRIFRLSKSEKVAVYEELIAQIQLCRKLGIPISHADSHNHIHEEPGVFPIVLSALESEKIPFLRLTNNLGKTAFFKQFYRNTYNLILKRKKLAATNFFGSISDFENFDKKIPENSIIELMIHPGKIEENQVFDVYSHENLSAGLSKIIQNNLLISYNHIT